MTALPLLEVPDDRVSGFATHDVTNQPDALENYDVYSGGKPLVNAVRVFGADWAAETLTHTGTLVGSERVQQVGRNKRSALRRLTMAQNGGLRFDNRPYGLFTKLHSVACSPDGAKRNPGQEPQPVAAHSEAHCAACDYEPMLQRRMRSPLRRSAQCASLIAPYALERRTHVVAQYD